MKRIGFAADLIWGARWGGFVGLVFMVFAGSIMLLSLGAAVPDGANAGVLLAAYPATGALGGLVVGSLRPWLRSRRSEMGIGALAALPVSIAFLRLLKGPFSEWGALGWVAAFLGATWIGGMGGYVFWTQLSGFGELAQFNNHERRGERRRHRDRADSPRGKRGR